MANALEHRGWNSFFFLKGVSQLSFKLLLSVSLLLPDVLQVPVFFDVSASMRVGVVEVRVLFHLFAELLLHLDKPRPPIGLLVLGEPWVI